MSRAPSATRETFPRLAAGTQPASYRDASMTSAMDVTDLEASEADEDGYSTSAPMPGRPILSPRTLTNDSIASTPRSPVAFGLESTGEHARPLVGSSSSGGRRVSYAPSTVGSTDEGATTPTADVFNHHHKNAEVINPVGVEDSNLGDVEEEEEEAEESMQDRGESDSDDSPAEIGDDDVEYTLKDRQDAINIEHPFGLPIWKPALYKKSRTVTRNAEQELHLAPSYSAEKHLLPGNILWTVLFGSWLCIVCYLISALLWTIPWGGSKYGRVIFELGGYLFWPFGKYVEGPDDSPTHKGAEKAESVHHGYDDTDEETEVGDIERSGSRSASNGSGKATLRAHQSPAAERKALVDGSVVRDYGATAPASRSGSETAVAEDSPNGHKFLDLDEHPANIYNQDDTFRIRALGRISYWVVFYFVVAPLMLLVCTICWGLVFTIPMAKLLWVLLCHLAVEPLALHFRSAPRFHISPDATAEEAGIPAPPLKPGQLAPRHSNKVYAADIDAGRLVAPRNKVLLCTYKAIGLQYYKYTVDGVNIMFINLLPLILFVIFDNFVLRHIAQRHPTNIFLAFLAGQGTIFVLALLSVIPLSYFIGMAVASISAQSSIGMGAVINATFGSIIEIILYSIALIEGKSELVEGSIVGSLLAGVLLMPGLSMVSGAVRRKEQRFNAKSAGVTSTMLIMAIIGTLTPTLFYEIYGTVSH